MSDARAFWQEVERAFDPKRPVQDPALFARREPRYDQVKRLEKLLRRPFDEQKYLVAGNVGTGKTSALFNLAHNLAADRMVVFVDLWSHFQSRVRDPSALDRLEPWELIGLLGLAIVRAGEERFGHRWKGDEPKALEKAIKALREAEDPDAAAEINIAALAKGIAIAAGGVVGTVTGGPATAVLGAGAAKAAVESGLQVLDAAAEATTWTWRVGLERNRRRSDQDAEVRALLHAINRIIMSLQSEYRRLLLVVDGLDRIRDPDRLSVLFVRSSLLSELVCDQVFTAPTDLLDDAAQRAVAFRSYDLCNVPVLDRENPSAPGPGIGFFHELVDKRMRMVQAALTKRGLSVPSEEPIPSRVIDRLAYYCGGLVREFVRMIAFAAGEAWEREAEAITDEIVQEVLRDARELKELRITRGEIELLTQVMQDPSHRLPDGTIAHQLLREQRLLPYPNDTPWYYPHPLLTLVLLAPGQPSAS